MENITADMESLDASKAVKEILNPANLRLLQTLLADTRTNTITLAEIKVVLKSTEEAVKNLSSIVHDDHNGKSLTVRMAVLENEVRNLQEWQTTRHEELQQEGLESSRASWQLRAAMLSGVMGFVTSLVVLIVTLLSHVNK